MMVTIDLPIWIIIAAVAVPGLYLFGRVFLIALKRRKSRKKLASQPESAAYMQPHMPSGRFRQDLMALQIDAVFNGLVALIETERLKLKALVRNNALPGRPESRDGHADPDQGDDVWETIPAEESAINPPVARQAATGSNPDGIANHLGLSLAEVDLAMKMQAARMPHTGRKLEAVA